MRQGAIDPRAICDFYQELTGQKLEGEMFKIMNSFATNWLNEAIHGTCLSRPASREPGVVDKEDVERDWARRNAPRPVNPKPQHIEHAEAYRRWRSTGSS
jgi:hypothetical protein